MFHYPLLHMFFESLAYFVGIRYFLFLKERQPHPESGDARFLWVMLGAVAGAVVGAKLVFWLHRPDLFSMRLDHPLQLLGGKTILGGFLGGVLGVELAKKLNGIRSATGDLFVFPILLGLMVGRLGCFFGGVGDATHGLPSGLPWAIDFGDGIPRHPTQLYEILFAALLFPLLSWLIPRLPRAGDGFKLFMSAYLLWRLFSDFLKPRPVLYPGGLSGIQLASLAGLVYYLPHFGRIGVSLWPKR